MGTGLGGQKMNCPASSIPSSIRALIFQLGRFTRSRSAKTDAQSSGPSGIRLE
jgi:hypothetical protein